MMNRKERWFVSIALILSVLPFLLVAVSLQFLPDYVPIIGIIQFSSELKYVSKYENLYMGLFCIVPFGLVMLAKFMKKRLLVDKNFLAIIASSILISLVFLGIVLYSVIIQANSSDILSKFDFLGVIVLVVTLLVSVFGTFLADLHRNDFLGLKNKYTLASSKVWDKVHYKAGDILTIGAVIVSIPMSLLRGWINIIIWIVGVCIFSLWVYRYSKKVYDAEKAKKQMELKENSI